MFPFVASSGCVFINPQFLQQVQRMQSQHFAYLRLMLFASVCVMLLPLCTWGGLAWKTKAVTLKSLLLLVAVECVLLATLVAMKRWFF
jgi:hypothetical protein